MTGSSETYNKSMNEEQSLERYILKISLGNLCNKNTKLLVNNTLKEVSVTIDNSVLDKILTKSNGNPSLISSISTKLYEAI